MIEPIKVLDFNDGSGRTLHLGKGEKGYEVTLRCDDVPTGWNVPLSIIEFGSLAAPQFAFPVDWQAAKARLES